MRRPGLNARSTRWGSTRTASRSSPRVSARLAIIRFSRFKDGTFLMWLPSDRVVRARQLLPLRLS
jgi:hypothetical protein